MKQHLEQFGEVLEHVSLKKYNTFKIDGSCKYLVTPKNVESLQLLLRFLKEQNICFFLLGNGSNIILSDQEYDGVMIKLSHFNRLDIVDCDVYVGAGVMIPRVAMQTIEAGLTGFEWAVGIPGTVGGCVYGNAEAYKVSTFDFLVDVTVITPENELRKFEKSELSHAYRTSFFKENPGYFILEAHFRLEKGSIEESKQLVEHRKSKRVATQPLDYPSAGSVFRNPGPEIYSGKLIEDLGFKGRKIGDALVSPKHANFILNVGSATGKDIKSLIELVHQSVKEEYGIDLKMEQEYVGWDNRCENAEEDQTKIKI